MRVFVAGHRGFLGSAVARRVRGDLLTRSRRELDLTDPSAVRAFLLKERPEQVVLAAGKGGGIGTNIERPAELAALNLKIQNAVIPAAHEAGVRRLIFFASSCAYPRQAPQPMREESLLTGPVEPTSEAFAVAKIAGIKLCEAYNRQHGTCFVTVVPATVYGPGDDTDPATAHVLPALVRRFQEARGAPVTLWGTGAPVREFLYVDDLADAVAFLLGAEESALRAGGLHFNVGTGQGVTIRDLAARIAAAVGHRGEIRWDPARPDGAPEKVLDVSRMTKLGWRARTSLEEGLRLTLASPPAAVAAPPVARLFRTMLLIRRTEEEVARIYPTDKIKSPVHLSIGQEAVAAAVCEALRPDDVVFGTYRSHASYLAKGGDLRAMMAELYGKVTGCARGKGGSMHLIDPAHGVMGTTAVVATSIPQAVGYAYALRYRRSDRVVASFFGDAATEEGAYHESLNFAALKVLPVLFVCENNHYAVHSPFRDRQPLDNIYERARGYGIPSVRIEDNDPPAIHAAAVEAVASMRRGGGPRLLEVFMYRWKEHVGPGEDFHAGYRSAEEARPWMQNDPIPRLGAMLPAPERAAIEAEVESRLRDAVDFAERSPFPAAEELHAHVFREP